MIYVIRIVTDTLEEHTSYCLLKDFVTAIEFAKEKTQSLAPASATVLEIRQLESLFIS